MKAKEERRKLQSLYDLIPKADIACVEGCSACCGPVNATREEIRRAPLLADTNQQLAHFVANKQLAFCGSCPYVLEHGGGCAIYDGRPFLCRLFGVTDEPMLKCPHGPRSTKPLSIPATERLFNQYLKLFTGKSAEALLRAKILWNIKREGEDENTSD